MKSYSKQMMILAASTTPAMAAQTGANGGSLLIAMFIGFAGIVTFFQLVPAVVIFFTMVKELFSPNPHTQKTEESKGH